MADTTTVFNAADDYERFMGRWSRAIGERFLDWLAPSPDARWLDVGCGTGAFSELIASHCAPQTLAGIDPSAEQIGYAREHFPRFQFEVADAAAIPFPDAAFDVAASALVLHFIPDRQVAFGEMRRVLAPGGIVGGYTWKREGLKEFAAYAPVFNGLAAIGVAPREAGEAGEAEEAVDAREARKESVQQWSSDPEHLPRLPRFPRFPSRSIGGHRLSPSPGQARRCWRWTTPGASGCANTCGTHSRRRMARSRTRPWRWRGRAGRIEGLRRLRGLWDY